MKTSLKTWLALAVAAASVTMTGCVAVVAAGAGAGTVAYVRASRCGDVRINQSKRNITD